MLLAEEIEKCIGCGACYNICQANCIKMIQDEEGFLYPQVDEKKCLGCLLCEKKCPVLKDNFAVNDIKQGYAAYNKNSVIRLNSSSGGIFSALAEYIISQGGIVAGAAFSKDYRSVEHVLIDSKDEIERLMGSKYIQSDINEIYKKISIALKEGKMVYFSGTPCQVAGLYSYLDKKYDNLFTQDIICHGVPSNLVWNNYLEDVVPSVEKDINYISFRNKKYGWKFFSLIIKGKLGFIYQKKAYKDIFMRGYFENLFLRKSCYNCKFKGEKRQADITVGDFWGVENFSHKMNDDKGTSLIVIYSEKGKELWDRVSNNFESEEVDVREAYKYNTAALKSVSENEKRKLFFDNLDKMKFEQNIKINTSGVLKKDLVYIVETIKRMI
ncbi:Coenzyme F420-reducing hydrogenase, beta subunit [Pseudobutyrivibrio sp. OR37]|uniref:Coenzyme F420 hydrogenase/dehydrogenase, beta subunit C-terminal domain n=1 Tax=Pseudobutyrivibrio sp. OR37 TaxID=1798186 RepID=UPI0008F3E163|nr:Coenzyme F420 hydrogenase/dehydrogenase, beta subunit C-terminal domain [Pseudobutyrivibrio sp. OR37]SFI03986.1 Coenzyme F420-reducing hydrogenase, beta subunit [Pseudobutyrivibrio sp. OR37]